MQEPPGQNECPAARGDQAHPGGGITAAALDRAVLAGVVIVATMGPAVWTKPSGAGWTQLILCALGLWVAWMFWRTARNEVDVPAHAIHPFLAVCIVILLGRLVAAGNPAEDLIRGDARPLIRFMVLALLVLLVQDVFSRVVDLGWLLTAMGLAGAVGAILSLHLAGQHAETPAVVLAGLAAVGMFLTPCLLPGRVGLRPWKFFLGVRVCVGGLLASILIVSHDRSFGTAVLAAGAVAASMILSGLFLARHRLALLAGGGILAGGFAVGVYRLAGGMPSWPSLLGWSGPAALGGGVLVATACSLRACRDAAVGDQARAALWSAVVVLAGAALLAAGVRQPGPQAPGSRLLWSPQIPGVVVAAAVALGLMPHLMLHRVRKFHGWPVAAAFCAVLVVAGLERHAGLAQWTTLGRRFGGGPMHFFAGFVLTVVLFWQTRSRRWWQAGLCALAGAFIVACGESAQKYLSTRHAERMDVVWDALGAAAAWGVFLLIGAIAGIERVLARRPRISAGNYRRAWHEHPFLPG